MAPPRKPSPENEANARVLETAQQLQTILDAAPPGAPGFEVYGTMMQVHEGVHEAEAALLAELLDLAVPDLARKARPLLTLIAEDENLPARAETNPEAWTGSIGERMRQVDWLKVPAVALTLELTTCGFLRARPDDTGAVASHTLYALTDGRLVRVDMMGTWDIVDRYVQFRRRLADSRVLSPQEAVEHYPLHALLSALHGCLWDAPLRPSDKPWSADIDARRTRFNALLTDLGEATRAHGERLRRVGDNPP